MNKVSSFLIFSSYVNPSYTLLLPSQQHVKIHQNHLVKRDSVSLLLKIGEDDDSNNPDAFSLKETLPVPSKVYASTRKKLGLKDKHFLESTLFISFPLLVALVSWFLYPTTSIWFHQAVQILGNNKWEPIDGGTLQWTILLPALNGVVMTCISLLYANLISTTGTQLRSRQITIHESLSTEVVNIRGMAQLIHYYPETLRDEFGAHLYHYTTDIMDEISSTPEDLESSNGNLDNYRNTLHYCGANDQFPASNIMDQSYETLTGIYQARNTRIVAVQTRFPSLHYVTITALTLTILLIFLLETDRKVILFLDKFQIRTVWGELFWEETRENQFFHSKEMV
jgi:hypothetical protein